MEDSERMTGVQKLELSDKIDAAADKDTAAQFAAKDAQIALLRAQLAERDAELDLLMLQWGHSNQLADSAVDTARTAVSTAKSLEEIARCARSDLGSTMESRSDP